MPAGYDSNEVMPRVVPLARQIVGVVVVAYIARRRGVTHGVLGSVVSLIVRCF